MTDFTTLTFEEIARFLVVHQHEIDCDGITTEDVIDRLQSGRASLEVRPFGFALIEHIDQPYLWILYVDDEKRGAGLGRSFMREIILKYASEFHLRLRCYGARRRKFFGNCGFRVESREGEMRVMTTDQNRY